jgi:hypothetical protein
MHVERADMNDLIVEGGYVIIILHMLTFSHSPNHASTRRKRDCETLKSAGTPKIYQHFETICVFADSYGGGKVTRQ